jgi:Protein of unknown function (DUF3515)
VIIVAVSLAAILVLGVVVVSRLFGVGSEPGTDATGSPPTGPVALPAVPAPDAGSADCSTLLAALPATLPGNNGAQLPRAELAQPAPQAAVAWNNPGSDPVVLRCGINRPTELTPDTPDVRSISGVLWLPVDGDGATSWYLIDRPVYVALTVPADVGTGALQDVSAVAGRVLPSVPLRFTG